MIHYSPSRSYHLSFLLGLREEEEYQRACIRYLFKIGRFITVFAKKKTRERERERLENASFDDLSFAYFIGETSCHDVFS